MRIVSWNVNGLRSALAAGALDPVRADAPDVLCLQETRTADCPVVLGGFEHVFHPAKRAGYAGTALVSREAPSAVRLGLGDPSLDGEGRVITAEYSALFLVTVYAPRSAGDRRRLAYRVRFDKALVAHVARLGAEKPVVVCGDFNATLRADDVYDGNAHREAEEVGFASDERDLLLALLEGGLVDAFCHVHPGARGEFTWWSPRRGCRAANRGWRLDYFLVSGIIADRIVDVRHLPHIMGSDHCPVELEIEL